MHDLDRFVSPIPRFEGDVPIPAIPILARDPGPESSEEPPAGSSASTPRTQACKRKAPANPNPPKKGNLWAGSRSLVINKKLVFQLLHRELQKGSRSFNPKGIFIISSFLLSLNVNLQTLPKMPNPPGSEDTHAPTGATRNLTPSPVGDLRHDAAHQSPRPDPAMHRDASQSAQSHLDSGLMVDHN
jgi:hypothetical protein